MMYAIDQRCIWFAEYLKCEPSLVQTSYEESGAIRLLDRMDSIELKSDLDYLSDALSHAKKSCKRIGSIV